MPANSLAWKLLSRGERHKAKRNLAEMMRVSPTPAEDALLAIARSAAPRFKWKSQAIVKGYILDVSCRDLRIALEADGAQHRLDASQVRHDATRDAVLQGNGWVVLWFPNSMVLAEGNTVREMIRAEVLRRSRENESANPSRRQRQKRRQQILVSVLEEVVKRGCPECAAIAASGLSQCQ